MIRVLIADDHKLVREGYSALLKKEKDIQIVGEAKDGLEALVLVHRLNPDVVLMDIQMPRLDGLKATRLITAQERCTRVLVVTMSTEKGLVQQALENGAKGYIVKSDTFKELVPAIRAVRENKPYFSASISRWVRDLPVGAFVPKSKAHSPKHGMQSSLQDNCL